MVDVVGAGQVGGGDWRSHRGEADGDRHETDEQPSRRPEAPAGGEWTAGKIGRHRRPRGSVGRPHSTSGSAVQLGVGAP